MHNNEERIASLDRVERLLDKLTNLPFGELVEFHGHDLNGIDQMRGDLVVIRELIRELKRELAHD